MPMLLPVDEFKESVSGLATGKDYGKTLARILNSASAQLESYMLTQFCQVVDRQEDFIISLENNDFLDPYRYLLLDRGFVTSQTLITAHEFFDLATNGVAVDQKYVQMDQDKGLITLNLHGVLGSTVRTLRANIRTMVVRVTHTSGLTTSNTLFGPVYENVPEWLKEAAIFIGEDIIARRTNGTDDRPDSILSMQLILDRYVRFVANSVKSNTHTQTLCGVQ